MSEITADLYISITEVDKNADHEIWMRHNASTGLLSILITFY